MSRGYKVGGGGKRLICGNFRHPTSKYGRADLPVRPDFNDGERSDAVVSRGKNVAALVFVRSGRRGSAALPGKKIAAIVDRRYKGSC